MHFNMSSAICFNLDQSKICLEIGSTNNSWKNIQTVTGREKHCKHFILLSPYDGFNPLPNDKIFHVTNLKAFADDKLNVAIMTTSLFDRVEKTVGK